MCCYLTINTLRRHIQQSKYMSELWSGGDFPSVNISLVNMSEFFP